MDWSKIVFRETDRHNAEVLIDIHKDKIRYCTDSKQWYMWTGYKWEIDHDGHRVSLMWSEIADNMADQIEVENKPPKPNKWKTYSNSYKGTMNALNLAKRDGRIQVLQSDFDHEPYELNTPKGTINLKTGILNDPQQEALHTKQTKFAPKFTPPKQWLNFLNETFQGDQELIDYMQRLMGLAMIGEVIEQVMPFALGPGGTGKSTFFNTIMQVMGDYAKPTRSTLLMRNNNEHPEEIAKLQGVRMVFMSELNEGDRFDESKLKLLTGNDPIEGRHMYKSSFSFEPSHTLFLFGNAKPRITEGGSGVWRRLRLIPFNNQTPRKLNKRLSQELVEKEGPQILAWLIEGAQKYLEKKILLDAQQIQQVTSEYENDEDILGQFIQEKCLVADNAMVPYKDFRIHYEAWCDFNGYKPLSTRTLTEKLKSNKKYGNIDNNYRKANVRFLTGITLLANEQVTA